MASRLNIGPDTLIPLSAFGAAIAVAVWFFGLHASVQEHEKAINELSAEVQKAKDVELKHWEANQLILSDLQAKTAAIDAKLSLLVEWLDPSHIEHKKTH